MTASIDLVSVPFRPDWGSTLRDVARFGQRAGSSASDSFGGEWRRIDLTRPLRAEADHAADVAGREAGQTLGDVLGQRAEDSFSLDLTGQASAAGDAGGGAGAAAFAGGLAGGLASAGLATIGAAALDKVKEGFTGALDLWDVRADLTAKLGLNEKGARNAGAAAAQLYEDGWTGSIGEASVAIDAVMSTLPDFGSEETQRWAEQGQTVADVLGTDVAESVGLVGNLIESGLVGNATEGFDLLLAGAQQTPAYLRGELLPVLGEYGDFLGGLGFTGAESMAVITEAAKSGPLAMDKALDALKEGQIRLTDGSALTVGALETIGLNAESISDRIVNGGPGARDALRETADALLGVADESERSRLAIALFGTPLEDMSAEDIPAFLESLGGVGTEFTDVAGTVDEASSALADTPRAKLEGLRRKGLAALTRFGDDMLTTFDEGGFPAVVDRLGEMWSDAWPKLRTGAESLFRRARAWIEDEGPEVARTIGRAIGDGAAAVGDWLRENWPRFARAVAGFYGRVATWVAEEGVPLLGEKAKEAGPALWQWVQDAYPRFARAMGSLWAEVGGWIATEGLPRLAVWGGRLWSALAEWLWTDAAPAVVRGLGSLKDKAVAWITGTAVPVVRTKAGELWDSLRAKAAEKGDQALAWLRGLPGLIGTWITGTALPALKTKATEWFEGMRAAAVTKGTELLTWLGGIPAAIGQKLLGVGEALTAPFRTAWADITEAASGAWGGIGSIIGGGLRSAGNLVAGFLRIGADVADLLSFDSIAVSLTRAANKADLWGEATSTPDRVPIGGAYAAGGFVSGGQPGRDSVPAMLMPGEFVQRTAAVDRWGLSAMAALNAGRVPPGWVVPGYSAGGAVLDVVGQLVGDRTAQLRSVAGGWLRERWPVQGGEGFGGFAGQTHDRLRASVLDLIEGAAKEAESVERVAIGAAGSGHGDNRAIGQSMAADRGWTGGEWAALNVLWDRESGWNERADNPTSSAYGIPQSLPGSKMATHGADWRTNPATQIAWGLDYIAGRYGTPSAAWAAWNARSPHWYADGGEVFVHRRSFDRGGVLEEGLNLVENRTGAREALAPAGPRGPLLSVHGDVVLKDGVDVDMLVQKLARRVRLTTP